MLRSFVPLKSYNMHQAVGVLKLGWKCGIENAWEKLISGWRFKIQYDFSKQAAILGGEKNDKNEWDARNNVEQNESIFR